MSTKGYGIDVILAESAGKAEAVKNKLMEIISDADESLQPQNNHVSGDWRVETYWIEGAKSAVTVKINEAVFTDLIFGRKTSSTTSGQFISVPFSAHIWKENAITGLKARYALNLADKIIDILLTYTPPEDDTSGIVYFYDITSRESEPDRGPKAMSRVIIEGFIMVKRLL